MQACHVFTRYSICSASPQASSICSNAEVRVLPRLAKLLRRLSGMLTRMHDGSMGRDPNDANHLRPASGDFRDFIGQIKAWLINPSRRGIPD